MNRDPSRGEGAGRIDLPASRRSSVRSSVGTIILLATLAAVMTFATPLHAGEPGAHPKIGLVLSGGGARGAAHVGILKVLEERHIPVSCIVGTSMGSIVGGLYSSGMTVSELEGIAVETDWDGLFTDRIPRRSINYRDKPDWPGYITGLNLDLERYIEIPQGLVSGKRLDLMLRSLTLNAPENFDDFPIPFRSIASDIETGNAVVLSRGDLAKALRASMAIPGVFAPVEIDGRLLVDGGVANNLAIDVAKGMGADIVIAVNIGTPLSTRDSLNDFLGVIDQITNILTNKNVEAQLKVLGPGDTLLTPELGTITTGSFDRMGEAIGIGQRTASEAGRDLSRYEVSAEEYRAFRAEQLGKARQPGSIDFVRFEQKSIPGSTFLLAMVTKGADRILKKDVMAYNIFELYKRGDFEDIDFSIVEEDGKQGLLIRTKPKEKSKNTVDLGLELVGTARKDNSFRVMLRHTATRLNRLGAEWKNELWLGQRSRLFTEIYQPLNPFIWHLFIAPGFEYENYPVELYQDHSDDHAVAEYRIRSRNAGVDLGLQMGEYGELRFGYLKGKTRSSLDTGISGLPDQEADNGAYRLALKLDRLDNPFFPTQGGIFKAGYLYGREKLGDDENHESIDATVMKPVSRDPHTVIFRGRWATNFDSTGFLARGFFLGGLFNLSGLNADQVFGNHLALGEVIYLARVRKLSPLVGGNLYAGASFEAGNVWFDRSDVSTGDLIHAGSVFIGIDSNIGPIYLGFGYAECGQSALYFSLGGKQF
ncbi:MAG TPA: patatin-like phospholipase family protein [Deltaproteobacteria bacterium]|nr:patatin-like phospholipase family protein [Deltaproteobacteria bacterium]HOI05908.1 patatin-like phospholipase family protein [Deltaproteobacteria bacterium]